MPRKVTKKLQRTIKPDRKYQSVLVQRLINKSMLNGKKQVAERAVYSALEQAAKTLKSEEPLEVFEACIKNISPAFEVKSRRVGGANYQIPFPIRTASASRPKLLMLLTKPVLRSRKKKIRTKWRKPTALSRISRAARRTP